MKRIIVSALMALGMVTSAYAAQDGHYVSTPRNQKVTCSPRQKIDIETEELQLTKGTIYYDGDSIPVRNNHAVYATSISTPDIKGSVRLDITINKNNTIAFKAQTRLAQTRTGKVQTCTGTALFVKS